jgi:hypothetical protein
MTRTAIHQEPPTPEIDASAVQRITGVPVGTLNVWINRQLVPGVSGPARGKARFFDLDAVLHISAMAALVRLGYPAPFAAMAAMLARGRFDRPGAKLIVGPPRKNVYGLGITPSMDVIEADGPEELDDTLDGFAEGRPEAFTILELDRLAERVRKAVIEPDLAERVRRERGALIGSDARRYGKPPPVARKSREKRQP